MGALTEVAVVGHLCIDLTPQAQALAFSPGTLSEVGPLAISLGGSVANTGRALVALGHRVSLTARVGNDALGSIASDLLQRSGLTGKPLITSGPGTSYSIVLEPEGMDRSFWHYPGANRGFNGLEPLPEAQIVHLGYPSLLPLLVETNGAALKTLLSLVRRKGAVTSVDLAVVDQGDGLDWRSILSSSMPLIDVISPSADDLRSALHLSETTTASALVDLLLEWGAGAALVSDGAAGIEFGAAPRSRLQHAGPALALLADAWADKRVRQPAVELRRRRTTNGAGDAATAGLLSGLLRGMSPEEATYSAARTAAAAIEGDLYLPDSLMSWPPQSEKTR